MVEGRGIAATASASSDTRKYAGLFSFDAMTRGDANPEQLEQAWYEELVKLQTERVVRAGASQSEESCCSIELPQA